MSLTGAAFFSHVFVTTAGVPYSGVRVFHYEPGTTTDRTVWTDEAATSAAAQPVVGDTKGRVVFYGKGNYRLLVKTSVADGDLTLYDWDPVKLEDQANCLRGELQATSYPAATSANRGTIFAKVDGSGNVTELAVNKDGTGWSAFQLQSDPLTGTQSWAKGADIASAATLTLGSDGNFFDVTGAVTITAISSKAAGTIIGLQFDGAPLLTHNATSLILAGGVNYQCRAGDILYFQSEGSGNWREIFQNRFRIATKGDLVVGGSNHLPQRKAVGSDNQILRSQSSQSDGLEWINPAATQAEQETGSSLVTYVTPGRQHYHPSAAKAWAVVDGGGTPSIAASYNVTSVTDGGVGTFTINLTTTFSNSSQHCPLAMVWSQGASPPQTIEQTSAGKSASACALIVYDNTNFTRDPNGFFYAAFGDQ